MHWLHGLVGHRLEVRCWLKGCYSDVIIVGGVVFSRVMFDSKSSSIYWNYVQFFFLSLSLCSTLPTTWSLHPPTPHSLPFPASSLPIFSVFSPVSEALKQLLSGCWAVFEHSYGTFICQSFLVRLWFDYIYVFFFLEPSEKVNKIVKQNIKVETHKWRRRRKKRRK